MIIPLVIINQRIPIHMHPVQVIRVWVDIYLLTHIVSIEIIYVVNLCMVAICTTCKSDSYILRIFLGLYTANLIVRYNIRSWLFGFLKLVLDWLISWRVTVGLTYIRPTTSFWFVEHLVHVAFSCDWLIEIKYLMSFFFIVKFELGVCKYH